jgi:hypothetical protein
MSHRTAHSASQAKAWLGFLLAVLLLWVSFASATHSVQGQHADHHDCAACLIAHGGVVADGATGAPVITTASRFALLAFVECRAISISDVCLVPGRGPPV